MARNTPVVSYLEVSELNKRLQEQGIAVKAHLSDACGNQSLWLEDLREGAMEESAATLYRTIDDYFAELRMVLRYNEDRTSFVVAGAL